MKQFIPKLLTLTLSVSLLTLVNTRKHLTEHSNEDVNSQQHLKDHIVTSNSYSAYSECYPSNSATTRGCLNMRSPTLKVGWYILQDYIDNNEPITWDFKIKFY